MKLKLNPHFSTILIILLVLELYFASQMYDYDSKVLMSNEIFNLNQEKDSLMAEWQTSIKNNTYTLTDDFLHLYCERDYAGSDKALFSVDIRTNCPLRQDLMIQYSISPSQLNLETDAAYISLFLTNGSNFITLVYVVGFKEQNKVPDLTYPQYSYIFYQVGNATTTFEGERNIRNDITRENLPITEHSWTISSISFGVISYQSNMNNQNHKMEAFFNAYKNTLYYQNLTSIKVEPNTKIKIPLLIAILITVALPLYVYLHRSSLYKIKVR